MDYTRYFLEPQSSTHRQYEALRAYFVEGLRSEEAAQKFGYTPGSFRVLCSAFRKEPDRRFFVDPSRRVERSKEKGDHRELIMELRKKNLSIYDICAALKNEGIDLSPPAVSNLLKKEGFSRLHRRRDEERILQGRPDLAPVADARRFDLSTRTLQTKFGGLFLFVFFLAKISLPSMLKKAKFPGTKVVPAAHAIRSLLALKLFGNARHSHIMAHVFDEGLALFAGLNVIPKRSFLTEYSCRVKPSCNPKLMRHWYDAVRILGLKFGVSFDLDFHTIPFHGNDALVDKHYVSKRSRKQKGMLAFVVQDDATRVFCYGNTELEKKDRADQVLRFAEFWKKRSGAYPEELVFDSQLTTYATLDKLHRLGIKFITLRRRSETMLQRVHQQPASAWRRIKLDNVARAFRTPRVLDERIELKGYEGPIRQIAVKDLGHEQPTIVITNQVRRTPRKIIGRYARRMIIENGIADSIDFFHMDALSSAVAMKVDLDLQLTLMGSSLYRLLGEKIGGAYKSAKSRRIFRDFIDTTASVQISPSEVVVRLGKRAHNPLLLEAGFDKLAVEVPWWENRRLRLKIG
jgi:transposase